MTGIELLQMIKNNEIKEGTEINVFREDSKHCLTEGITRITYKNDELLWSAGTFRTSMLWNDDILFEIVESKEVPNKIEKLYHIFNDSNKQETYYKLLDEIFYKVNELIDAVNYLLDKE